MAGKKISVEFDVQEDLVKMLEYAAEKYKLGDKSKALRCLLDFAAMGMVTGAYFSNKSVAFVVHLMEVGTRKSTKLKKMNDIIYLSY